MSHSACGAAGWGELLLLLLHCIVDEAQCAIRTRTKRFVFFFGGAENYRARVLVSQLGVVALTGLVGFQQMIPADNSTGDARWSRA